MVRHNDKGFTSIRILWAFIITAFFFPPLGLIPTQLPFVDYSGEDFSNSHGAVGRTPVPPAYAHGEPWYAWYGDIEPNELELSRIKKIYKPYLK